MLEPHEEQFQALFMQVGCECGSSMLFSIQMTMQVSLLQPHMPTSPSIDT